MSEKKARKKKSHYTQTSIGDWRVRNWEVTPSEFFPLLFVKNGKQRTSSSASN